MRLSALATYLAFSPTTPIMLGLGVDYTIPSHVRLHLLPRYRMENEVWSVVLLIHGDNRKKCTRNPIVLSTIASSSQFLYLLRGVLAVPDRAGRVEGAPKTA